MGLRSRAGTARRRAGAALGRHLAASPAGSPDEIPTAAAVMRRDQQDVEHIKRLLAFTLHADSCCIDVGAHRGAVLAEMVRIAPHGHHIAFEPLPHLCDALRDEFPAVEVHQAALSANAGSAAFTHVLGVSEGWSGLRFRPLPGGAQAEVEEVEVQLEVLDDVLPGDYRPAVIKIDVEGAEQQVLEGARTTLARHRPILVFEHGSGSAEAYGTSPRDIHGLLAELGYRIFDLDGNGPYDLETFERAFFTASRVNFVAHP